MLLCLWWVSEIAGSLFLWVTLPWFVILLNVKWYAQVQTRKIYPDYQIVRYGKIFSQISLSPAAYERTCCADFAHPKFPNFLMFLVKAQYIYVCRKLLQFRRSETVSNLHMSRFTSLSELCSAASFYQNCTAPPVITDHISSIWIYWIPMIKSSSDNCRKSFNGMPCNRILFV